MKNVLAGYNLYFFVILLLFGQFLPKLQPNILISINRLTLAHRDEQMSKSLRINVISTLCWTTNWTKTQKQKNHTAIQLLNDSNIIYYHSFYYSCILKNFLWKGTTHVNYLEIIEKKIPFWDKSTFKFKIILLFINSLKYVREFSPLILTCLQKHSRLECRIE